MQSMYNVGDHVHILKERFPFSCASDYSCGFLLKMCDYYRGMELKICKVYCVPYTTDTPLQLERNSESHTSYTYQLCWIDDPLPRIRWTWTAEMFEESWTKKNIKLIENLPIFKMNDRDLTPDQVSLKKYIKRNFIKNSLLIPSIF